MRVLVAGAGIGGLTAAVALRQAGLDVHVYEQAAVLREVGAGVAVGPNAVRVLHRLGLADALRAVGVASLSWDERDWQSGDILTRVPLATAAPLRWGAPFYNMHRADLHDALRAAVGDQHITLGARCVSVEQGADTVTIGFADGRHATGDVLIGADGVHSVVRDHVASPAQPTWWRQTAWRGLAPAAFGRQVGLEMRQHVFLGPGMLFVTYYVASGRLVNWIGCTPSDGWREESWSARGDRDEALGLFAGWHPQVQALVAGTEAVFRWAMFDRPPLERWTRGRVTLLGDAAHPMLPFMGQGAAQSIEDGFLLARCLSANRHDPPGAINTYAARRQQRAAALQAASRAAGGNLQLDDPADVAARNSRMLADPEAQIARYDWVWGYDIDSATADSASHGHAAPALCSGHVGDVVRLPRSQEEVALMPIIDAVNRWYAAWNAHDIAAIADAISPAGTYLDPTLDSPIDDQAIVHHAVSNLFEIFPDAHFEILTVGAMSETTAAAQWRMTGSYKPNGRPIATNGAEFFTYDPATDRLNSVVGYFDVLSARKQTRDSNSERGGT